MCIFTTQGPKCCNINPSASSWSSTSIPTFYFSISFFSISVCFCSSLPQSSYFRYFLGIIACVSQPLCFSSCSSLIPIIAFLQTSPLFTPFCNGASSLRPGGAACVSLPDRAPSLEPWAVATSFFPGLILKISLLTLPLHQTHSQRKLH